jgi:hypothetical protein
MGCKSKIYSDYTPESVALIDDDDIMIPKSVEMDDD